MHDRSWGNVSLLPPPNTEVTQTAAHHPTRDYLTISALLRDDTKIEIGMHEFHLKQRFSIQLMKRGQSSTACASVPSPKARMLQIWGR